jgi:hypothetical protein
MIRLAKDSRLVKFAYMGNVPHVWPGEAVRTSLCALFWRCVRTSLVIGFVLGIVAGLLVLFWERPARLWALVVIVGGFGTAAIMAELGDRIKARQRALAKGEAKRPSLVPEVIWAIKKRVCPLVEIR